MQPTQKAARLISNVIDRREMMHRNEITENLKNNAFEFFYWFSRFEFALKENGYLKDKNVGAKAEAHWDDFINEYKNGYSVSEEAKELIRLHPKRQMVADLGKLEWKPVGISHCNNDLCRIITMLKTVRNNLFHGGKHGDQEVDVLERSIKLVVVCKIILDQLAKLANFEDDYRRDC